MRTIQISTDVFQAIWATRRAGEETENAVLTRILGSKVERSQPETKARSVGFVDRRFGVEFPENAEIFRTYLGSKYVARAEAGRWHLVGTDQSASSLNELSALVGPRRENAWENWNYLDANDRAAKISQLRDSSKIQRRTRSAA